MANENDKQTVLLQLKSMPKPYTRSKLVNYVSRQMQVSEDAANVMVDNSLLYSVRSDMIVCFGSALAYIKSKQKHAAVAATASRKPNQNNNNNEPKDELR